MTNKYYKIQNVFLKGFKRKQNFLKLETPHPNNMYPTEFKHAFEK